MKIFSLKIVMLQAFIGLSLFCYSQKTITIKILETSDVHGAIFPYDFIGNKPMESSLAQVYTYVKGERKNEQQQVILLDNGDILQGQPTVYYSNYIDSTSLNITSRVFNFMEYDAATVGNHDIETGPLVYRKVERELACPWMAANATSTITGKPAFKPYIIIKRNGLKIAVLGLITPGIPNWLPQNLWPNMRFDDMVESASYWVQQIREKENPDLLVGLFHSGHNSSYGGASVDAPLNENASLLVARKVPGFDVIFIGHDHDKLATKVANVNGDSVLVLDPTSSARYISEATVQLSLDKKKRIVSKNISGKLVETRKYSPDSAFMAEFASCYQKVDSFVNQPLGEFTQTISSATAYFGPTAFMDFIHSAQFSITNADISFAAPLSFVSTINQGIVRVSDMFKLYRFENFLYTMNLTGAEVDAYMEYSTSLWFNTMKDANDHLLRFRQNADGSIGMDNRGKVELASRYYNFDSAAGIVYTIDVSKPDGDKVTILSMTNGEPFDTAKTYRVAINSYRGNGGGGHLTRGCKLSPEEIQKRIVASTDKDLRFYIMKFIEQQKVITPESFGTWKIIPEEWAASGAARDRQLLFSNPGND
jgi:2',3'-cyclic-nucleotide 2'-phosphodiesterase/3'-nucleotidase